MLTNLKLIPIGVGLLCVMLGSNTWAWSSPGHRVIAQIAYQDLTPKTRLAVRELVNIYFSADTDSDGFVKLATWADDIRGSDIMAFNHWHYINKPYLQGDRYRIKPWQHQNVVWAITQSERALRSETALAIEKAWFLGFYIHLVGDVHQPLHCVELYSVEFPQGDKGGNRYLIKSDFGENLHEVWDRGFGCFDGQVEQKHIKELAIKIRNQYPRQLFNSEMKKYKTLKSWAKASYTIATTFAYQTAPHKRLSQAYCRKGKTRVMQQLALAGYRLADGLNEIFD